MAFSALIFFAQTIPRKLKINYLYKLHSAYGIPTRNYLVAKKRGNNHRFAYSCFQRDFYCNLCNGIYFIDFIYIHRFFEYCIKKVINIYYINANFNKSPFKVQNALFLFKKNQQIKNIKHKKRILFISFCFGCKKHHSRWIWDTTRVLKVSIWYYFFIMKKTHIIKINVIFLNAKLGY